MRRPRNSLSKVCVTMTHRHHRASSSLLGEGDCGLACECKQDRCQGVALMHATLLHSTSIMPYGHPLGGSPPVTAAGMTCACMERALAAKQTPCEFSLCGHEDECSLQVLQF